MEIQEINNWTDARELIVGVQSKMTAKEINRWNELTQANDLETAKAFVQGILIVIELDDTNAKNIQVMKDQLRMFENCLQRCNYIVGWENSGLTVDVEQVDGELNTKNAYVCNSNTPVMWEEREAKLLAKVVKNGGGIHPRVFGKQDWYNRQIERLTNLGQEWRNQRNITR